MLRIASRIASGPLTEQPDYGSGGASVPRGCDDDGRADGAPEPGHAEAGEVTVTISPTGKLKVFAAGRQVGLLSRFSIEAGEAGPPSVTAEFLGGRRLESISGPVRARMASGAADLSRNPIVRVVTPQE